MIEGFDNSSSSNTDELASNSPSRLIVMVLSLISCVIFIWASFTSHLELRLNIFKFNYQQSLIVVDVGIGDKTFKVIYNSIFNIIGLQVVGLHQHFAQAVFAVFFVGWAARFGYPVGIDNHYIARIIIVIQLVNALGVTCIADYTQPKAFGLKIERIFCH